MIRVQVNLQDAVSEDLAAFISALTGPQADKLSEGAGIGARDAAIAYHRQFDQSGGWRGKRYLGPSQTDGTPFGSTVADGWRLESSDASGAVISNDADHYAFKVRGGTIRPKRAKALTIPMTPEAKGLRASVYTQNTGKKLFTIKGRNALFERIQSITSGSRGRRGQAGGTSIRQSNVRPVYALLKSVTMGPWPNAVPPEEILADAYAETYREGLIGIIEGL